MADSEPDVFQLKHFKNTESTVVNKYNETIYLIMITEIYDGNI